MPTTANRSSGTNRPTRSWVAIAGWLVLLLVIALQWRSNSRLRRENNELRAQPQAAAQEGAMVPAVSTASEPADIDQLRKDRLELLRLSNEVQQLRQHASPAASSAQPASSQPGLTLAPVPGDDARQLTTAAMGGDTTALDKLATLAAGIRTMKPDEQAAALSGVRSAFEFLGAEAGKGNTAAVQALWQASRIKALQGFATQGLGQAAGLGNEEALKPLLDPDAYLLLRSSAVAALKPAADAGNARAIQALAATAADPKQQALWLLAAQGLETAAAAGDATAIDGLATIAAGTNQVINRQAVLALEAAARNRQPRAEEALRKLGWR